MKRFLEFSHSIAISQIQGHSLSLSVRVNAPVQLILVSIFFSLLILFSLSPPLPLFFFVSMMMQVSKKIKLTYAVKKDELSFRRPTLADLKVFVFILFLLLALRSSFIFVSSSVLRRSILWSRRLSLPTKRLNSFLRVLFCS
jgi:hypothetical protein